jgi:ubiquinone/menaquinone biosynthesis C-methylase UbiE
VHFEKDLSDADWDDVRRRQVARLDLTREWIALTGMRAGSRVLDIGPGPGEFTCEYAKVVGAAGRVYALEKAESAVAYLRRALEVRGLNNVVVLAGDAEEALDIDGDVDLVVITDVLHHVDRPQAVLHKVAGAMCCHTKVLIAEFDPDAEGVVGPPLEHRLAARQIKKLLDRAGLRILDEGRQAYEHYFVIAGRRDSTTQGPDENLRDDGA